MSFAQYRPENALRRARDLERAGHVEQAFETLSETLSSRRWGRQWMPAHEEMMLKFIDLAVEFRENRACKEGLYVYRNLSQAQNPASLEKVYYYLIDSAMKKAAEARARTDNTANLDSVEDLEEEQSPESLLLGGVSSEGSRERAEREIVVPWMRHMWDTFRNVLESARGAPKLEHVYHAVAVRAMNFCKQYNRHAEFKKLAGTLSANYKRMQQPLSQESIEKHMATRFVQLEHCADMSLWSLGFNTAEEIHSIMDGAGVVPKAQLMATYYEKLARIFWVSENYLFHAYAWHKFFSLSVAQNKALTEEDKRVLATAVVLAALAIPIYASGPAGSAGSYNTGAHTDALEVDMEQDKKKSLARLLRLPGIPSREALMAEIAAKGIFRMVRPEVSALYRTLEADFQPLTLVQKMQPMLAWIGSQTGPTLPPHIGILGGGAGGGHSLSQYVPNVERLLVFRLLEQLSQVYTVVKIPFFHSLVAGLHLTSHEVEKLIGRSVKNRQLSVRIDHREGVMRLGNDTVETVATRRQLTELAARLQAVVHTIAPASTAPGGALADAVSAVPPERRQTIIALARMMMDAAQRTIQRRKEEIEKRKEDMERAKILEEQQANMDKQAQAAQAAIAAQRQQEAEEAAREAAARKAAEAIIKLEQVKKLFVELGRDASTLTVESLAKIDLHALDIQAKEKALKAREEETRKRADQARRMEYLTRALREAERAKVEAALAARQAEDSTYVQTLNDSRAAKALARHQAAVAVKASLTKMIPYIAEFEGHVAARRMEEYKAAKKIRVEKEREQFYKRKIENAQRRKEIADRQRAEEEAKRREAEADENRRKLEERKQRDVDMMQRDAATRDSISTLRQANAELRGSMERPRFGGGADSTDSWRRGGSSAAAAAPAADMGGAPNWRRELPAAEPPAAAPAATGPPRFGSGSWRDREAAKAAAGGGGGAGGAGPSAAAPPTAAAPPAERGAYRPPAARAEGSRWR